MLHPGTYHRTLMGIGDTIACLPMLEQRRASRVLTAVIHRGKGLERLFEALAPTCDLRFSFKSFPQRRAAWVFDGKLVEWIARDMRVPVRHTCSAAAVARIDPLPRKDFIVVHPHTYSPMRQWDGWKDLALDVPYVVVGSGADAKWLDGELFTQDFFETARLLRASRGVLCVNSAVMHLANVLGVRCVCVHKNGMMRGCFPSLGVNLIRPRTETVREKVWSYLWGS